MRVSLKHDLSFVYGVLFDLSWYKADVDFLWSLWKGYSVEWVYLFVFYIGWGGMVEVDKLGFWGGLDEAEAVERFVEVFWTFYWGDGSVGKWIDWDVLVYV